MVELFILTVLQGTPVLGAIISDQYLGKYKTILYSAFIYVIGVFILFCTSLPWAIEHGAALGGLIASMVGIPHLWHPITANSGCPWQAIIGLGTGGIKSNVSPLVAEQYRQTKMTIRILKSGERVIVDPAMTIQRIYMVSLPYLSQYISFAKSHPRSSICASTWAV